VYIVLFGIMALGLYYL